MNLRRIGLVLILAAFLLALVFARGEGFAGARARTIHNARISVQSDADAAWEGLDGTEQHAIEAIGLTGEPLDRLVLAYENSKRGAVGLEGSWSSRIEQDNDGTWGVYLVSNELPHTL